MSSILFYLLLPHQHLCRDLKTQRSYVCKVSQIMLQLTSSPPPPPMNRLDAELWGAKRSQGECRLRRKHSLAFPEVYSQVILEAPPPLPSTIWLRAQMPGPPASRRTSEALTGASKKAAALPCNFRLFHHRKFNHRHRRNWFYHRSTSQIYQAPPPYNFL